MNKFNKTIKIFKEFKIMVKNQIFLKKKCKGKNILVIFSNHIVNKRMKMV